MATFCLFLTGHTSRATTGKNALALLELSRRSESTPRTTHVSHSLSLVRVEITLWKTFYNYHRPGSPHEMYYRVFINSPAKLFLAFWRNFRTTCGGFGVWFGKKHGKGVTIRKKVEENCGLPLSRYLESE